MPLGDFTTRRVDVGLVFILNPSAPEPFLLCLRQFLLASFTTPRSYSLLQPGFPLLRPLGVQRLKGTGHFAIPKTIELSSVFRRQMKQASDERR